MEVMGTRNANKTWHLSAASGPACFLLSLLICVHLLSASSNEPSLNLYTVITSRYRAPEWLSQPWLYHTFFKSSTQRGQKLPFWLFIQVTKKENLMAPFVSGPQPLQQHVEQPPQVRTHLKGEGDSVQKGNRNWVWKFPSQMEQWLFPHRDWPLQEAHSQPFGREFRTWLLPSLLFQQVCLCCWLKCKQRHGKTYLPASSTKAILLSHQSWFGKRVIYIR